MDPCSLGSVPLREPVASAPPSPRAAHVERGVARASHIRRRPCEGESGRGASTYVKKMSVDAPIELSSDDDEDAPTPASKPASPTPPAVAPDVAPAPAPPAPTAPAAVPAPPAPAPAPAAAPPTAPPAPALLDDDGTRASGLYIALSSIPGLNEPGLFTSKAIAPGGFIAIYTGRFMTNDEHDRLPPAEQDAHTKYALVFKGSPVLVLPGAAPDLTVHPAAAANEPPRGGVANALVETQVAEVDGVRYVFAALFACAVGITANTEVRLTLNPNPKP